MTVAYSRERPRAEALVNVYASAFRPEKISDTENPIALLGRACVEISRANPHAAKRQLDKTKRLLKMAPEPPRNGAKIFQNPEFLSTIADFLTLRRQPAAFAELRDNVHEIAINNISKLLEKRQRKPRLDDQYRGRLNELTCLCLFNRYRHPWMAAMPSLSFQDNGEGGDNFDLLLLESVPDHPAGSNAYKLQAKSHCLGFCGREIQPYEKKIIGKMFKHYNSDISLVSGCCDLANGREYGDEASFATANLLIKEAKGIASDQEVAQLDTVSNNLLLAVTSDPRRHGTASVTF